MIKTLENWVEKWTQQSWGYQLTQYYSLYWTWYLWSYIPSTTQEDSLNDIISCTFPLLSQGDGHTFWLYIVKMIDEHGIKEAQYLHNIQFINSINNYQYDKVMSYNNIADNILQKGDT